MIKIIKVLLVDDHTVARNGIKLMLSTAANIQVTCEAETAQEALDVLKREDFDVVLLDIALPDKNGLELLKLLHHNYPKLAILIISMYSEEIYAIRALKQGAKGYLTKNSSTDILIAAVNKVAGGGKYISPFLMEKLADMLDGEQAIPSCNALSDREIEVLRRITSGENIVKIADALHLSPSTITTYRARIMQKTGMKNNIDLARFALENGLLL